ncbi:MAG: hypothetical protein KA716_28375 [Gloeotrichia echinulata DEX184]|nr:hypothetical protein [Gloeotrichia echinulata DEX184]
MAESFQQSVTEVTQALRTSTVIQRLARRSTEPSGIVDLRPFQSEYTLVLRWIVQRSALLDQIYKRYNSQDNALAQEADLVLAAPSQPVPREQITLPSAKQTAILSYAAIAKPVTQISTSEPSLEQSTAPSYAAIAKPVTQISTSDSSPSGKFRVTRKAIPLPNIKAGEEQVQSLQGEIPIQSSKLSNQSPVAGEIASTLHQFSQPEQSLILPKLVNDIALQPPTSNSENHSFSTKAETVSGDNFISSSPTEIEESSLRQNSTQQDVNQNQLPVAGEIASTLHQFSQPEQSLILPKRISETSTSNPENPSFSTNILNNSSVAIAREIPANANFVAQHNMIWRKSDNTTTSEKFFSGVTNSNTQPGMPRGNQFRERSQRVYCPYNVNHIQP